MVVDPNGAQPAFRFPPSSTLPTPGVTNSITGGFPPSTIAPGPVGVNNTVGTNFGGIVGNSLGREPVSVNLPPGARVVTNSFGVSEVVAPPPVVVGTNIGGARGIDQGMNRGVIIPRSVPPTSVPRTIPRPSRGPILDSRDLNRPSR